MNKYFPMSISDLYKNRYKSETVRWEMRNCRAEKMGLRSAQAVLQLQRHRSQLRLLKLKPLSFSEMLEWARMAK